MCNYKWCKDTKINCKYQKGKAFTIFFFKLYVWLQTKLFQVKVFSRARWSIFRSKDAVMVYMVWIRSKKKIRNINFILFLLVFTCYGYEENQSIKCCLISVHFIALNATMNCKKKMLLYIQWVVTLLSFGVWRNDRLSNILLFFFVVYHFMVDEFKLIRLYTSMDGILFIYLVMVFCFLFVTKYFWTYGNRESFLQKTNSSHSTHALK